MARRVLAWLVGLLIGVSPALAQAPEEAPASIGEGPGAVRGDSGANPISSNPGAINAFVGTGRLGELLGFDKESGIRVGGLWIGDSNWEATGGLQPGHWALNSLTLADLNFDAEKLIGLHGGMAGIQFLQYTGQPTNALAGAVTEFNSLDAGPPRIRQEIYQLWWRQTLLNDKLIVRIGKLVPTYDFNNVLRPVPTHDAASAIPAVSGLNYTPIFLNPTLIRFMPGYYNSACGMTTTLLPTEHIYLSYGVYDGNVARGEQIGLRGPQFDGYYFHIGEAGVAWQLGPQRKPGNAAIGAWGQTGQLATPAGPVNGAQGLYCFGAQRLWFRNPGIDNSGVSGFWQFGFNDSNALLARQYFGAGLTAFGLIPSRKDDSMGVGVASTWLNTEPGAGAFFFPNPSLPSTNLRTSEVMVQTYYQMNLRSGVFFQPTLSWIPNPGVRPDVPGALALTLRLTILF